MLVVVVAAAGGQLACAGVVRARPTRGASADQVVVRGSFSVIGRGFGYAFGSGDYLVTAYGVQGPIVINDALGTTSALDSLDSSCVVSALGPPWLVVNCLQSSGPLVPDSPAAPDGRPYYTELYSLSDGTQQMVKPLPHTRYCPNGSGSTSYPCGDPDAVGADWIEWYAGCYQCRTTLFYQNIQTGKLQRNPTNATTFPDLNSPNLAQKTCPGVRLIRASDPYGYDANPWGSLTYDGKFALVTTVAGKVFLERCGTNIRRLLDDENVNSVAWNASVIVWQPARNRLSGLFLPSLQTFTMPLPPPVVASERVYPQGSVLALTSKALYLNEYGGKLWRTPFPPPRRAT